jgi:hypothetical protein
MGSAGATAILDYLGDSMFKLPIAFATALLGVCLAAHAQNTGNVRYKWVDGQGLPHFSDSLSAEALKYGYSLVNDHGLVVQRVPRQLSLQERAEADKLAAVQAASQRAKQEQASADTQMLAAYPDEASYTIAQQQTLDTLDQQIRTTQINLRSQEKALTDLLSRAADLERAKKPVPKFLADSIAEQRNVVTGQRDVMARQQAERVQDIQQQASQLARYRQLSAAQNKPSE